MMGSAIVAAGFTNALWIAAVMAVVAGAGNMLFLVPSITLVQQLTPAELRGRVLGVRHMLTYTAFMVSNASVGWLADTAGVSLLMVALGGGMVALGGMTLVMRTTREAT
jgi:hypothetical protein